MLTFLLRILAFVWVLWFLRRILGLFVRGPVKAARSNPQAPLPKDTVKDPVCGMYMDPRLAIRVQNRDGDLFFCSEECRQRYLSGPV